MKGLLGLFIVAAACGDVSGGSPDARLGDAAGPDGATCVPSPAGTEARWRAEMNASDDTGRYDGIATGISYVAGRHGSAFDFDSTGDVITTDPGDALWPAASFSVESWIKTTSSADMAIVGKYDCGGAGGDCSLQPSYWNLLVNANGYALWELRAVPGGWNPITATATRVNDGMWHHLVGVRDVGAKQQVLYVDGVPAVTNTLDDPNLGAMADDDGLADVVTIGSHRENGTDNFTLGFIGAIDEVAFYSRALSATEVAALYTAPDGVCP